MRSRENFLVIGLDGRAGNDLTNHVVVRCVHETVAGTLYANAFHDVPSDRELPLVIELGRPRVCMSEKELHVR